MLIFFSTCTNVPTATSTAATRAKCAEQKSPRERGVWKPGETSSIWKLKTTCAFISYKRTFFQACSSSVKFHLPDKGHSKSLRSIKPGSWFTTLQDIRRPNPARAFWIQQFEFNNRDGWQWPLNKQTNNCTVLYFFEKNRLTNLRGPEQRQEQDREPCGDAGEAQVKEEVRGAPGKFKSKNKWTFLVWFGLIEAIVRKAHFIHKMLDVKGLFSIHSPDLLQCCEPRSRLDASLRLGALVSWEKIHEPEWPWHFSWLIFVARGLESPAKEFGREPNIGLIFEYFLPYQISFPNSVNIFYCKTDISDEMLSLYTCSMFRPGCKGPRRGRSDARFPVKKELYFGKWT